MTKPLLTLALLLYIFSAAAQKQPTNRYQQVDKLALQIPDSLTQTTDRIAQYIGGNFTSEEDKLRASYVWIASAIQYDVENMYAINLYDNQEDKVSRALASKKGVCENYAALFNDICSKLAIKSYVVQGYVKQNGNVENIPHAWCVAFVNEDWQVFDPTWGAGYVSKGKFYKKLDSQYFMMQPSAALASHMPFDYLWQLVSYPITSAEFYEGKTQQEKSKKHFSYIDSIAVYEAQSKIDQLKSSARRVEKNGVKNSPTFDYLRYLKLSIDNIEIAIENKKQTERLELYNSAVNDYNKGVHLLNSFINYRNNRFIPQKTDDEIQQMLDAVYDNIRSSELKIMSNDISDSNTRTAVSQLAQGIKELKANADEHQQWLEKYFSKGKLGRKSMFGGTKVTIFGIPFN